MGDLALVERDIRLRATQISVLLGKEPQAWQPEDLAIDQLPKLSPVAKTGLPAEVLERRPDIRAAYLRIQSADQGFAAAVADLYPRLSLSAGAETQGKSAEIFSDWIFNLAANFLQPIFDGGERKAVIESKRAELSEAINLYSAASIAAFQEVEAALIEEEHLQRYRISLEQRTNRAVQIIEQLRDSYLNQQSEFLDVLTAQTSLQDLQRELIETSSDLVAARIALLRAAAGTPLLLRPPLRDQDLVPTGDKK